MLFCPLPGIQFFYERFKEDRGGLLGGCCFFLSLTPLFLALGDFNNTWLLFTCAGDDMGLGKTIQASQDPPSQSCKTKVDAKPKSLRSCR